MTSMTPMTRTATFRARDGRGAQPPPEVADGEPLGGARMLRGSTGATAFSMLDAPDLSQDTRLLARYDLEDVGEQRRGV